MTFASLLHRVYLFLEQALRPEWQSRIVSEDEKITLFQQKVRDFASRLQHISDEQ